MTEVAGKKSKTGTGHEDFLMLRQGKNNTGRGKREYKKNFGNTARVEPKLRLVSGKEKEIGGYQDDHFSAPDGPEQRGSTSLAYTVPSTNKSPNQESIMKSSVSHFQKRLNGGKKTDHGEKRRQNR